MSSSLRESRLATIRQILAESEIFSQDELVQVLSGLGHSVTQSSVSRDMSDLGVQKVKGRYMLPMKTFASEAGILSAVSAGPNLIVFRTEVGAAQLVASRLDQLGLEEIIGTVAGDDTIFVATGDGRSQQAILSAIGAKV
jgi:transcriptional regulator of arginine metabolism